MSAPFGNQELRNLPKLRAIVTSHSIDGTFESCERRFEFMHVWQQSPEGGTTGFAAEVGTALHEAIQAWARLALFPGRDRHAKNPIAIRAGLYALMRFWPWSLETVSLQMSKAGIKQRSLGEAILLFEQVIRNEFWESWELVNIGGFDLSIEVPWRINHASLGTFPLPAGEMGFLATQGKIDFILRNRYTGEIRVFDLKTTVKDKRAHEAAFKFSGQGANYAMVISHALGYDWKQRGLSVSYLVANFASADGSEEASVNLYTYEYNAEIIQDLIDTKHERLIRMRDYAHRKWWPRRTHGCDSYGQPCPFMGICERRDEDFIKKWFAFENFEERSRIYEPIWELIA
jgi:hypothetical protein